VNARDRFSASGRWCIATTGAATVEPFKVTILVCTAWIAVPAIVRCNARALAPWS